MCLNNLRLSRRSEQVAKAEIRNMTVECERVGGINLAQGVCDMPVPGQVIEGAKRAMDDGLNAYTRHDGIALLRQAIAQKMADYNGISTGPKTGVVVTDDVHLLELDTIRVSGSRRSRIAWAICRTPSEKSDLLLRSRHVRRYIRREGQKAKSKVESDER